jgi:hypothetical protein
MVEHEPNEYQFKHETHVSLDEYRGVGRDIMELNHAVTDGFMRVSDMRGDIVITQKPQARVTDYDQVGNVRVGKFLRLPNIYNWNTENSITQIKRDNDTWHIAINDQELAQNVAQSNDGTKKFDDIFIPAFQKEIKKGMAKCLKNEKLLNGGKYDFAFQVDYSFSVFYGVPVLGTVAYETLTHNLNFESAYKFILGMIVVNAGSNLICLLTSRLNQLFNKMGIDFGHDDSPFAWPDLNEPFVKHSAIEHLMPAIPIDRLIRGNIYLDKNGEKLIKRVL